MSAHFIAVSTVRGALTSLWRTPRGDIAERLATHVTVGILTLTAAVLLTSHYWGEPIQCWVWFIHLHHIRRCLQVPAQYTSWWVQFVNNYCYVHGTYYVPLNEPLSWDSNERKQIPVHYYQWVRELLSQNSNCDNDLTGSICVGTSSNTLLHTTFLLDVCL
jgi:hypothetical protein